jgi:outer membrane receptor protein involved in Fe transport
VSQILVSETGQTTSFIGNAGQAERWGAEVEAQWLPLDERTVVNARLGIDNVELGNGTLRASLWSKNIFDQDYPTFGINFGQLGLITEQYAEEARFGLAVTYEF